MSAAEEQDQLEIKRAEEFVQSVPKIDGIEGVRIQLGEDWAGDPSLWLIFTLRKDLRADDRWVGEFLDYSGDIQSKILHSKSSRFPYTKMESAA